MRSKSLKFLFILALVLVGCTKIKETETHTLHINFQDGDIPSIHPHHLTSHLKGYTVGKAIYEGLTRLNESREAELAGAAYVEIAEDNLTYIFTLRDHCWSNGKKATAHHYEQAWKEALSPESECRRPDLFYPIKNAKEAKTGKVPLDQVGVKALDEKTLLVELANPIPYFMTLLARPDFSPLFELEEEPTVYNGPFVIESWKKNDELVLKANPYYWDKEHVALNTIDITMITDPQTVNYLYEKGDLDWIGDPISTFSPETQLSLDEKGVIQHLSSTRFYWLYLNTQSPPLTSPSIRLALSSAINRDQICKHILIGDLPLYTPLPTSLSLCKGREDDEIEYAQTLFQQGLKELNLTELPPLELSYAHIFGGKKLAEYLKERWEHIFGIEVRLKGTEWNVFRAALECGDFQMGGCFGMPLYSDQIELLGRFESLESWNFCQWENLAFQKKMSQLWQLPKSEERNQLLRELEGMLSEEMPYIPISNHLNCFACHPLLKGYIFDHAGCVDFAKAYFDHVKL